MKKFQHNGDQTMPLTSHAKEKLYVEHISFVVDLSASKERIYHQLQEYRKQYENYDWKTVTVEFSYKNQSILFEAKKTEKGRNLQEAFNLLSKFTVIHRAVLQTLIEGSKETNDLRMPLLGITIDEKFSDCFNKPEKF